MGGQYSTIIGSHFWEVDKLKVESAKLDIVTTGNIPPTMHMAKEKDGTTKYRQK